MHKLIVTALALCGISHWATAPSNKPPSNAQSPTIEPSQQAAVQLALLDGDGSPVAASADSTLLSMSA